MTDTTWACIGIPPHVAPCGEHGDTEKGAEQHTKATQHSTSSGHTERGVEAMVRGGGGT